MSAVRVCHENYLDTATQTYSSQKSAMPATNVGVGVRRTKVWRTDGYWVVTSANKGIVLQTTDGVNQTVNIAEGTYTTDATFLAAVDTALTSETSGAAFTVTRNATTNKIVITSDGAGGTIFKLMCTNASFTAASLLGFSTAADRTGALTYTADTLKIHTSEWLKWDCGTSVNPKAFILIGLRNTAIKISETATLTLQGSSTDVWTSPEYTQTLTYNEHAIGLFSTTGLHTSALRYWRLLISDVSNTNGYVEISNIYLGDAVIPTQGAVQFPLRQRTVDLSERLNARSGVSYSDTIQLTDEISFNWEFLTKTEKEELEDFVRDVGLNTPWFICLDPDEVFSSEYERTIKYVKFMDGPTFVLDNPNSFSSDWSLREEV